jgi:hypothetical protein
MQESMQNAQMNKPLIGEMVPRGARFGGKVLGLFSLLMGLVCAVLWCTKEEDQSTVTSLLQFMQPTKLAGPMRTWQPMQAKQSMQAARPWPVVKPAWVSSPSQEAAQTRDMSMRAEGEYGASGTSFYTKTEKQDSYDDLDMVLKEKCKDDKLRALIVEMLDAVAEITEALRQRS